MSYAGAAESVYLTNGFCLHADSHEQLAASIVLHSVGGTIEVKVDQVDHIEASATQDSTVAPAPRAEVALPADELLKRAALAQGLPPEFVRSVSKIESSLRQAAVSSKGALGLMQLMPSTAAQLGVDPTQADQNAAGGARYLRELLVRYHYDSARALAAYNAGPGAVAKANGVPPIAETVRYVQQVLKEYAKQQVALK